MRGRPPALRRTRNLTTALDEELLTRLDLHLFSEVEGRVPKGAYQSFLHARLREFFDSISLDLAPFAGSLPGTQTVRGSTLAIEVLSTLLKGKS